MSTAIEQIRPETLAMIEVQARKAGISSDEYIRVLLPPDERELALRSDETDNEFERDMSVFAEDLDNSSVYLGTYSREDITTANNIS